MTRLWIDCETYSSVDLKAVGTYVYACHQSTEVLLVTYALGNGPVQDWSPAEGESMPPALLEWLTDSQHECAAHNALFDRQVLPRALARGGWITPSQCADLLKPERWFCTMVQALSHALPGGLDELGRVLGLSADKGKLKDGKTLIRRFCQPAPSNHKASRYDHRSHPELWARFREYARQDIVAMRECARRMPTWNFAGRDVALWRLDQRINDRGFQVDRALCEAGARAAEAEKARLGVRFRELTRGQVDRPSQRAQLADFIKFRYGLTLPDTKAETLRSLMKGSALHPELRELFTICIASNKTSTSKYGALLPAIGEGGRFRGGLQFAGAGRTRRFAGRLYQPQNLPSRGLPPPDSVDLYIDTLKLGIHDVLFENLMLYGAAALRGVIVAPAQCRIFAADLSNIEGRILAWIAGEQWKLDAFRAYDAGTGPDLYNITANMITGVDPWKVPKPIRNAFGKVPDLASGYQGGVAGYQTFANAYGVKMADHWDTIQQSVDATFIAQARINLHKSWARAQIDELEIDDIEWVASETCKLAWRARHPATVQFWYALQDAAIRAITRPGEVYSVTKLKLSCRTEAGHQWLQILLPSGRRLCYFHPAVEDGTITYWGLASDEGSTSRAWIKNYTHGGKLTGNVCQTLAGDLLKDAMPAIEQAGFPIVLSVHDEVVCEGAADRDVGELSRILATNPPWAPDLPLAAAGFSAARYRKE